MEKLHVINLFGGPGTGKSTLAAALFTDLKMKGINAELVTEFAKDLV
jgi:adenylylsulfate kinase-like enzyme